MQAEAALDWCLVTTLNVPIGAVQDIPVGACPDPWHDAQHPNKVDLDVLVWHCASLATDTDRVSSSYLATATEPTLSSYLARIV